jgi:hypothetical protein
MRSTRTEVRRRRTAVPVTLLLAALLGGALLGLVACGGSASSGDATPAARAGGSAGPDSFTTAWPQARDAMRAVAGDAMLLTAGTMGLVQADTAEAWSFTFFSPSNRGVYAVNVDHGVAGTPQELGTVKQGVKVKPGTDIESINVGASEAIAKARARGEKSWMVPGKVVVGGVFAELPGAAPQGYKTGVWTVAFASKSDLSDAQTYEVDMTTGKAVRIKGK